MYKAYYVYNRTVNSSRVIHEYDLPEFEIPGLRFIYTI